MSSVPDKRGSGVSRTSVGTTAPRRRIAREQRTIRAMIGIYCRHHHGRANGLCAQCTKLLAYAHQRLGSCPFQEEKPACNHCGVHCYSTVMRDRVKAVMRYAGPRMFPRHPLLSLYHLFDRLRRVPTLARTD